MKLVRIIKDCSHEVPATQLQTHNAATGELMQSIDVPARVFHYPAGKEIKFKRAKDAIGFAAQFPAGSAVVL